MNAIRNRHARFGAVLALGLLAACTASPEGIAPSQPAAVTVHLDFLHRPLPEIPLPNDVATRYDATSPTRRRINASMVAPTFFEKLTRQKVDELDGWGVFAPITIPFTGLVDLPGIMAAHHGDDYATANDLVYVVNIDKASKDFGKPVALDVGNGNYPMTLEQVDGYWEHDARGKTLSVAFEESAEDANGNGQLDPGEDQDLDGVLDAPNYLPGKTPKADDLVGRANALMTFYERETNTLILRPLRPMRERTTYAVVVTRRLKDAQGQPVGSPYPGVNHAAQTDALQPLVELLATRPQALGGLGLQDVAFAWTFTTGTTWADLRAVRDGLYGHGAQKHLATEFPPDLAQLYPIASGDEKPAAGNLYVIRGELLATLLSFLDGSLFSFGKDKQEGKRLFQSLKYIDYHVFGSFRTPKLFKRTDADGNTLSYNEMSWPPDVERVPVEADSELVTFWLSVPRKEISVRKDGKPAPLVIVGHGYTGSKLDTALFGGSFAQHGMATLTLDNVSHGVPFGAKDVEEFAPILESFGIGGLIPGLMAGRHWDQDLDGTPDSGGDFWTAYTFHTRDVLRQTAVDYLQLVRILRAFDGKRTWGIDSTGDGQIDAKDVAGDFDGDGVIDVGGPGTTLGMTGSSLGGIMSAIVGGLEPQIAAVVPMCGGGGLADVGIRSTQGGVREAVLLRIMGPLYVGYPTDGGQVVVRQVVPSLNDVARIEVARMAALKAGDSVLARNLDNGEVDCALVRDGGAFRVALPSDVNRAAPQRHVLEFYAGNAFVPGLRDPDTGKACTLVAGAKPVHAIRKFESACPKKWQPGGADACAEKCPVAATAENPNPCGQVRFHYQSAPLVFDVGAPLSPLAEGLGLHRARPELRRFLGFAQLVLDPADPAVHAYNLLSGEMKYATGETVNTHAIVLNTVGDMNVPVSTGATIGRAAGLLDYTTRVAAWGQRTANQVLIDLKVLEGVDKVPHFVGPDGQGTLVDPEDLSGSAALSQDALAGPYPIGKDGFSVPRLTPGLHTQVVRDDGKGGISGTFFPLVIPEGKHDLDAPGVHADRQIGLCQKRAQAEGQDPAACKLPENLPQFDQGSLLRHMIGYYLASGGKQFRLDPCQSTETCPDIPPPPPARP